MSLSPNRWQSASAVCLLLMTILVLINTNSAASICKVRAKTCRTEVCKTTATEVLSYMKPDVDPCTDFYQFACGGFLEKTVLPADKAVVDNFSFNEDKIEKELESVITEERPATDPKHLRMPNTFYKACMNTTLIEKLGASPMQKISESLGGWPVVKGESWDPQNNWTWQQADKDFRRLGLFEGHIVYFGVDTDYFNTTKRILYVDDSYLVLDREYEIEGLNNTIMAAYYDLMVDIAVLMGAKKTAAEKEMLEAVQFEIDLAKISLSAEARRDANLLQNPHTIKQMQEKWPYNDWLDYFNALVKPGVQVDENERMNVASLKFMDDLGLLLKKTPKRTIANYLMWRAHYLATPLLSQVFVDRLAQFNAVLTGVKELRPRWKRCISRTTDNINFSVGSLYVQKYFPERTKKVATEMVDSIRDSFNDMLKTQDWMDEKTRTEALKKLQGIQEHVGYPDELTDNEKLAEYYKDAEIDEEKYLESDLKMTKFYYDISIKSLRLPVDRNDWKTHSVPTDVNAYYNAVENGIQIPAAILQGHFFNADRPKYMNYGAIGWIIGHEFTHGFDDEGSQFDATGNLLNWWQNSTKAAYLDKARCIINQYANYTESTTGLKLNGIITQGENIADNGGIKETYLAYKNWVAANGAEPQLPSLKYTPEQMFWISAGQTWCSKLTVEYMKYIVKTDPHSPTEFRVNGSFKNQKQFAADFKCPAGSPMNPVEKCEVW